MDYGCRGTGCPGRKETEMAHDSYGQIKVRVTEDRMGNVLLQPVSPARAREVARSNDYDGASDVYLQRDYDIEEFMRDFPQATWINPHTGEREINSGCVILVDSWTFRHMVGGQSD